MLDFLTTSDAARLLGVSPDMVRCYERTGRLTALRTTSGVRLFRREDVEDFIAKRSATHNERLVGSAARS
jgi:excisionase family DNA binding protein